MANTAVMAYLPRKSIIHALTGTTKLSVFLLFSAAGMITYDTRVLFVMLFFSLTAFSIGKIKVSEVKLVLILMLVFLALNNFFIFLLSPEQGVEIYGTRHEILHLFGPYSITLEQLFYTLNISLKYFIAMPIALLFISTTDPSEFASSLNSIGLPYRGSYAIALALRYIPDIQRDYHSISQAKQARGIELGKKEAIHKRIKNAISIIFPLILSSLERIETISNAMELRGFGKHKSRTWYRKKPMKRNDYIALLLGFLLLAFSIIVTYYDGERFYNPFLT